MGASVEAIVLKAAAIDMGKVGLRTETRYAFSPKKALFWGGFLFLGGSFCERRTLSGGIAAPGCRRHQLSLTRGGASHSMR